VAQGRIKGGPKSQEKEEVAEKGERNTIRDGARRDAGKKKRGIAHFFPRGQLRGLGQDNEKKTSELGGNRGVKPFGGEA